MKNFLLISILFLFSGCYHKVPVPEKIVPIGGGIGGIVTKDKNSSQINISLFNKNSTLTNVLYSNGEKDLTEYTTPNNALFIKYIYVESKNNSGESSDTEKNSKAKKSVKPPKKPYELSIQKYFHHSEFSLINALLHSELFFASLGMDSLAIYLSDYYSYSYAESLSDDFIILKIKRDNSIITYKPLYQKGKDPQFNVHKKFLDSKEMNIIIQVENKGLNPIKDTFYVTDILPPFFELIDLSFNGESLETIYFDSKKQGDNKLFVFELTPKKDGFKSDDKLFIKIRVKSNFNKFIEVSNLPQPTKIKVNKDNFLDDNIDY